ncbi:TPA: hypothetical protein ACTYZB_004791 [Klebsiella variicola]
MTKLLDLDAIIAPKKEVKISGEKYPIAEMTVGLFAAIKQFEGKDLENMPMTEQVESYTHLVREVIPTVPNEVVKGLNIEQLQRIFAFAMEQAEEENEAAAGESAK